MPQREAHEIRGKIAEQCVFYLNLWPVIALVNELIGTVTVTPTRHNAVYAVADLFPFGFKAADTTHYPYIQTGLPLSGSASDALSRRGRACALFRKIPGRVGLCWRRLHETVLPEDTAAWPDGNERCANG